jgi:hypothetical protein
MQFSMQLLQSDWSEPAGWALMALGVALATWTLGQRRRTSPGAPVAEPVQRRNFRHARRIGPAEQWQRLVSIAEAGFARAETLATAHAPAVEALEATDDLFTELVADLIAIGTLSPDATPLSVERSTPVRQPRAA